MPADVCSRPTAGPTETGRRQQGGCFGPRGCACRPRSGRPSTASSERVASDRRARSWRNPRRPLRSCDGQGRTVQRWKHRRFWTEDGAEKISASPVVSRPALTPSSMRPATAKGLVGGTGAGVRWACAAGDGAVLIRAVIINKTDRSNVTVRRLPHQIEDHPRLVRLQPDAGRQRSGLVRRPHLHQRRRVRRLGGMSPTNNRSMTGRGSVSPLVTSGVKRLSSGRPVPRVAGRIPHPAPSRPAPRASDECRNRRRSIVSPARAGGSCAVLRVAATSPVLITFAGAVRNGHRRGTRQLNSSARPRGFRSLRRPVAATLSRPHG